jgi:hypothetical protein
LCDAISFYRKPSILPFSLCRVRIPIGSSLRVYILFIMRSKSDQNMIPDEKRPQASVERPLHSDSCHEPDAPYAEAYSAPLHRRLKSRHLQMIAIGGIIGPGLFVGSGNALHLAGPGGILISFSLVGIIVFFVMQSLGELATLIVSHPFRASFSPFRPFQEPRDMSSEHSLRIYDLCLYPLTRRNANIEIT